MANGNYIYNPNNPNGLKQSDIELAVLNLLTDICKESSNTILQNAVINYWDDMKNLADEFKDNSNAKLLVMSAFNPADNRNTNFNVKYNSGESIHAVFRLGFVAQKGEVLYRNYLLAIEEIISGATNNHNGTSSTATQYQITLSNGKIVNIDLMQSIPDDFITNVDLEHSPNYLTSFINILFIINK